LYTITDGILLARRPHVVHQTASDQSNNDGNKRYIETILPLLIRQWKQT